MSSATTVLPPPRPAPLLLQVRHAPAAAPAPSEPATVREAPGPETELIRADGLSVFYGDFEAVKKVSLSIPRHRVVAFIGPSGCGKSTFLRAINRLNDLIPGCRVTGRLSVGGRNVYDPGVDLVSLRRQVGLVFQKPNPFPKIDGIVEECLRRAALWDEVKDRLRASALGLSGGQQQRLCIARALATRPRVLLMDEPASALDPIATGRIEDLISELKASYTIVVVTHNMQQAARVSDHTAFFYLGRLVEYDRTSTIFTNPCHKQTEDYVTGRFG
jgi:phosphate transport system ATP-binding protein